MGKTMHAFPLPHEKELLFLVRTKEGHEYKLYLNGMIEGFPEDVSIINCAAPLYCALYSLWKKSLPTSPVSSEQTKVVT